jgi:glutathione S-transferase
VRLYHHPFSSNARKAVMTALVLDAPVELVMVDLPEGAQRKPDFLALNPNGKVPVLVDDDFVLWESGAIMAYLADKVRATDEARANALYPSELRARADVHRWMYWGAAHWAPAIGTLNFENMLKPLFGLGEADASAVARAGRELTMLGALLDAHLAKRAWVSGDGLTLADIALACPLMATVPAKLPVTGFANVQRWFAQVQELPAWKETAAG